MNRKGNKMLARKSNILRTVTVIYVALFASNLRAQGRIDIIQIWQNFIASSAAAEKCEPADKETQIKFLTNLQDVTIRTAQALQERNPGVSQNELVTQMKSVGEAVRGKVYDDINVNGCTSPKIQQMLRLYKMHAEMRLGG